MTRSSTLLLGLFVVPVVLLFGSSPPPIGKAPVKSPAARTAGADLFNSLLAKHEGLTYDQLHTKLVGKRDYRAKLTFDPTKAAYYERVHKELQLTDDETALFKKTGFVSSDARRRHSFASAYYQIYARDLPVFVTSDSILHALHRSYDAILMELETTLFAWTIGEVLTEAHNLLDKRAAKNASDTLTRSYKDVDLYLTVARNLLAGAGAPVRDTDRGWAPDEWDGKLVVTTRLNGDREALALLKGIQSLELPPKATSIYGGERKIDFSQFRPRGHYTKSRELKRYFRTMMWLGRIDCGWNVLPTEDSLGIVADSDRELRNAALLVEVARDSGGLKRLATVDAIIAFLVGRSDNLTPFALAHVLKEEKVGSLADLEGAKPLAALKKAITDGKHAKQMIRSQVVLSDPRSSKKTPPPAAFQFFGQRFILDSFVLSQVVFDSIVVNNVKHKRMMPSGLDVMAALGNPEAVPLLKDELTKWKYSGNLMACRDFVTAQPAGVWKENLYNLWLDALRTLSDRPRSKHLPEAMQTQAWERKQLQTQLASWAELRHDTILYAKQSYTGEPLCHYPAGYVEPYPDFYARVKFFAEEAARLFEKADYSSADAGRQGELRGIKKRQVTFFQQMAKTVGTLEALAKKELKAEKFTEAEQQFLKKTVDIRGGGSGPPRYDGWYCELFYNRRECNKWEPIIADVHTDPESKSCLEVGTGDAMLGVIAIDNEKDRAVYVGPLYSYYEFRHPVADRLTDAKWGRMIETGKAPKRPEWVNVFQAPAKERAEKPRLRRR